MVSWAYPLIMGAAICTGLFVSRFTRQPLPLRDAQRLGIGIGAFIGAMLGAKLPFAVSDWNELLSGRAWFADGKTILSGLAGGYLGVVAAKWALGVRTRTGDSFAVPVAASIAVGRLGCFAAGCCYGTPTSLPWGVVFPEHGSLPRHPTQFYESAFHALAALGLSQLERRGIFRGNLFKLYIIAYAAFRFATEFIRDEPRMWLELTGYQWSALAMIAVFGGLWWHDAASDLQASSTSTAAPGSARGSLTMPD